MHTNWGFREGIGIFSELQLNSRVFELRSVVQNMETNYQILNINFNLQLINFNLYIENILINLILLFPNFSTKYSYFHLLNAQ